MSYFLQAVNFHLGVVEGLDICVTLGKLHVHGVPALGDGQHYQSGHAVPQAVNLHLGEKSHPQTTQSSSRGDHTVTASSPWLHEIDDRKTDVSVAGIYNGGLLIYNALRVAGLNHDGKIKHGHPVINPGQKSSQFSTFFCLFCHRTGCW